MLTAYKFRLYPNKDQKELFSKYFGCTRVVWNKALELRESYYKEHKNDKQKKGLNYYDTARFLRELKQKEEYKWLKEANSQSLQQALMDLDKAFKVFFKGISKYPNYKKKTNRQSFRVPQFFNFTDNLLYLPKMGKGIKMEVHREFPLSRKQKDSKNRDKARLMVAKTHEKVASQRNDFLHKVSTAITKQFDTIVIETLNIKEMKKNHSLAKAISNVSWSRFFEFIKSASSSFFVIIKFKINLLLYVF